MVRPAQVALFPCGCATCMRQAHPDVMHAHLVPLSLSWTTMQPGCTLSWACAAWQQASMQRPPPCCACALETVPKDKLQAGQDMPCPWSCPASVLAGWGTTPPPQAHGGMRRLPRTPHPLAQPTDLNDPVHVRAWPGMLAVRLGDLALRYPALAANEIVTLSRPSLPSSLGGAHEAAAGRASGARGAVCGRQHASRESCRALQRCPAELAACWQAVPGAGAPTRRAGAPWFARVRARA